MNDLMPIRWCRIESSPLSPSSGQSILCSPDARGGPSHKSPPPISMPIARATALACPNTPYSSLKTQPMPLYRVPRSKRSPVPDTCPTPSQIIMMSKLLIASFVAVTYAANGMYVQCPAEVEENSYCDCDADVHVRGRVALYSIELSF